MCAFCQEWEKKNGYGARDIDRKVQKLYNTYIGRTACGQVLKGGTPLLKKPERAFAKGREALLRECIQAERSAALRGKGAKDRMRELKNDTREIR